MDFSKFILQRKIAEWLEEDIGGGDVTTNSIVPAGAVSKAVIHAKQAGIVAGIEVAELVFKTLDKDIAFKAAVKDGDKIEKGTILANVEGNARTLLIGERLALNLMQRMSGVATRTNKFVELVKGTKARIVDTRKTMPGLRMLDKYSVVVGGGANHRLGLYDAVLIKDNHIKVAGGIREAVESARAHNGHTVKIEVEVESMAQVEEAIAVKADIIMLDNMDNDMMTGAVQLIDGRAVVEASGGVNEETTAGIARTGVDIISVGAITHSVYALDISMDIGEIK